METTGQKSIEWVAGLFEGEGYLWCNQDSTRWIIGLEMTDKDVIDYVASVLPLNVTETKRKDRPENHKIPYNARTGSKDKIFTIVSQLYPFMFERRRKKMDEFLTWYSNLSTTV